MFCFLVYGHPRDLHVLTHSFPTRRSSDLVIGEADCPLADIEHELAISAVVILPAAVQVAERVVRQLLDRAFERLAAALEIVLVIARNRDLDIDLGQRDLTVGVARLNALDLAGIAITIEADEIGRASCRERVCQYV